MTYALLALAVVIIPVATDTLLHTQVLRSSATWVTFFIILVITFIVDSFLTTVPIVTYDATKLLGIHLGSIPIEDFSYTFAAVFLPRSIIAFYERR